MPGQRSSLESPTFADASRENIYAEAKELLPRVIPSLKQVSQELQQDGYPVDVSGRIDPEKFQDIFTQNAIRQDLEKITEIEEGFDQSPSETRADALGELVEVVIIIAANRLLFNQRLRAVRTSKRDDYDYKNHIDLIVLDTETHQSLAVINATTKAKTKYATVLNQIGEGGGQVKYGLELDENNKVHNKTLSQLPIFIMELDGEKVLALAKDCIKGVLSTQGIQFEADILKTLQEQCEAYPKVKNISKELKGKYQQAGKIFNEIAQEILQKQEVEPLAVAA